MTPVVVEPYQPSQWPGGARCAKCEEMFLEGETMYSVRIEEYPGEAPADVVAQAAKAPAGATVTVVICGSCAGRAA